MCSKKSSVWHIPSLNWNELQHIYLILNLAQKAWILNNSEKVAQRLTEMVTFHVKPLMSDEKFTFISAYPRTFHGPAQHDKAWESPQKKILAPDDASSRSSWDSAHYRSTLSCGGLESCRPCGQPGLAELQRRLPAFKHLTKNTLKIKAQIGQN